MPVGYLITTAVLATVALAAASRHRPRRSSPLRLSYLFGLGLNWPNAVFGVLIAATALAVDQGGARSPVFWLGLGFAVLASAGLLALRARARGTGPAVGRALAEGLGARWGDRVGPELTARLRRRPSLFPLLFATDCFRRHGVERVKDVRYGPEGRSNLLDLYRDPADRSGRPALIYLHGGGFRFGSKRLGARLLLDRLAREGWVCVSANYRLGRSFPDPLIDAKRVLAWVREHAHEHGVDPDALFIAGSSAGGHAALLAALTPDQPRFQPGFESADTSVAGAISLYGYYGPVRSDEPASSPLDCVRAEAPPCFVAHGDQDTLVVVDEARLFVERLRAASASTVVYAELPGAQHGFDLFRSRRFATVIDAIEGFATWVLAGPMPHRSG